MPSSNPRFVGHITHLPLWPKKASFVITVASQVWIHFPWKYLGGATIAFCRKKQFGCSGIRGSKSQLRLLLEGGWLVFDTEFLAEGSRTPRLPAVTRVLLFSPIDGCVCICLDFCAPNLKAPFAPCVFPSLCCFCFSAPSSFSAWSHAPSRLLPLSMVVICFLNPFCTFHLAPPLTAFWTLVGFLAGSSHIHLLS